MPTNKADQPVSPTSRSIKEDHDPLIFGPQAMVGRGVTWMNEDAVPERQGYVAAWLGDGYYLIQMFGGMIVTEETDQFLIHISDLAVKNVVFTANKPVFSRNIKDLNIDWNLRHRHTLARYEERNAK